MAPKISVIVPVSNSEEYLGQCLDSILLQKMDNLEVICINNASTDGSLAMLQTYSMFDSRLKIINSEKLNNSAIKNIGISQAEGEFITFLKPMDFYEESMLKNAISIMDRDKSDFLISGCFLYDNNKNQIINETKINKDYLNYTPMTSEQLRRNFFLLNNPSDWNQIYRTSFIRKNNLKFDENICNFENISFLSQGLIFPAKISLSETPFLFHRVNTDKKDENPLDDIFISTLLSMKNSFDRLGDKKKDDFVLSSYISNFHSIIAQALFLSPRDKKENLLLIPKYIPHEITEKLFFCPRPHVKVSLVICVHGSESNLERCLESIIHQTLEEIEIICVDCSDDSDLLPIIERYAKKDKRIKILTKQQYEKENSPYEKGMKLVTGVFVQFLDSNDFLELDTCESLYIYSQLYTLDMCLYSMFENDNVHLLSWMPNHFQPVFNIDNIQNILFKLTGNASASFYRYGFLRRNKIQWKSKTAYSKLPFFIESVIKAERLGALNSPLYHQNTKIVWENFEDYALGQKAVLKLIKKYICYTEILNNYLDDLSNYVNIISKNITNKRIISEIYYLYFLLLKDFHYLLKGSALLWCKNYLKNKNILKKLNFKYYLFASRIICDQYSINLFKFQRKPFILFSLLGIPILKIEISPRKLQKRLFKVEIFSVPVFSIQK